MILFWLLLPGLFLGSLLCAGAWVLFAVERRRNVAQVVVQQMAMVTSQNIPLATGLSLAGKSEAGRAGLILQRIGDYMSIGLALDEAIRQAYPSCPGLVQSVVHTGQRAGRLSAALRTLQDELDTRARQRTRIMPLGFGYALMLLLILVFVWTAVVLVIIPKFKEIFSDFAAPFPMITIVLMEVADTWSRAPWIWLWLGSMGFGIPLAVYLSLRPRRVDRPRLLSRLGDRIRWAVPGLRRLEHASGMVSIASLLRVFLATGMRLDRAVGLVAETDMNLILRERLWRFAQRVERGTPPAQAAEEAQLGPVMTSAFRIGSQSGRMDTALTFVADYYRSIVSRLWILVRNVAWPTLTVLMAVLVGTFVVGMFLPLVALINSVLENM